MPFIEWQSRKRISLAKPPRLTDFAGFASLRESLPRSVPFDSNSCTETEDRADVAFRADWPADCLTERDEIRIPVYPVFDRQNVAKPHFGLERIACLEQSEPVADAMHMNINTNGSFVESLRKHEIRGLPANSRQFYQVINLVRNSPGKKLIQCGGQLF